MLDAWLCPVLGALEPDMHLSLICCLNLGCAISGCPIGCSIDIRIRLLFGGLFGVVNPCVPLLSKFSILGTWQKVPRDFGYGCGVGMPLAWCFHRSGTDGPMVTPHLLPTLGVASITHRENLELCFSCGGVKHVWSLDRGHFSPIIFSFPQCWVAWGDL